MIKFGPSGNSDSFYEEGYERTEEAARYVKERGLDCFEYSFGRGVRMSEEKACSIRAAFEKEGVEISVHAPYFINFANPSDEMAAKGEADGGKTRGVSPGGAGQSHARRSGVAHDRAAENSAGLYLYERLARDQILPRNDGKACADRHGGRDRKVLRAR